ncbi:hypothetical protein [Ferruginibacter sp.]|nr:hypothetical protein [Ferruginibacter sp.]
MYRKLLFILILFFFENSVLCQKSTNPLKLSIVSISDTVFNEKDGLVKLELENTCDTPILLSNYFTAVYATYFYVKKNSRLVKGNRPDFKRMDLHYNGEMITQLNPGEKTEVLAHMLNYFRKKGLVKIKFYYKPNVKNSKETFEDPSTSWVTVFNNLDLDEYERATKEETKKILKNQ